MNPKLEQFGFNPDPQQQQSAQAFARPVVGPVIVILGQASQQGAAVGDVNAANGSVVMNLTIDIDEFC